MTFTCTIYGIAQPQSICKARRGRLYRPLVVVEWKKTIVREVLAKMDEHRVLLALAGPLYCSLRFFLPRPKYMQAKKYPDGPILKPTKPDADNYEKAVWDCLSEGRSGWKRDDTHAGLWVDDAQVCQWAGVKYYCGRNDKPCVELVVMELD